MLLTLRTTNTHGNARSTADAVITALTPAAWYRNATDVVSSGGFASIWADYASTAKGLVLPGVNGNYASTPNAAPLQITGDIDIAVKVSLVDWSPTPATGFVSKGTLSGAQNSYYFGVAGSSGGLLRFIYSPDGTTLTATNSSAVTGVTDGATKWVRVTYNSSTGKVNFYTGDDGSSWSALGTEQTIAAAAIFNSSAVVSVGADSAGTTIVNGIVYRAIIKSGIGGTTVFDADFSSQAIGAGSFTESSSNAATVTINASGAAPAHIGKARDLLQGTGTNQPAYAAGVFTFDGADNYLKTAPIVGLAQPETLVIVGTQVAWTNNDYLTDGNSANTGVIYQSATTPNLRLYAGGGTTENTGAAIGNRVIFCAVFNGASSVTRVNDNADVGGNCGAGNMGGITLGGSVGVSFASIKVEEFICFAAALSDAERDSVITALNNALTVF